ncbi:FAD-dependent thymidylate synthase [bacterium]|nr:FAD-dependent thymidylate synthase [bacterium]
MRVIEPYFEVETPIDKGYIYKLIEKAGRTAYKSENLITDESAEGFIKKIVSLEHESVLEHFYITVRVVCDRGVSHELVRHRIASYTQESTRYCNYSKGKFGKELTFIKPFFWSIDSDKYQIWLKTTEYIENSYLNLIELGATPQEARAILPNSLKTEIVVTMNIRSWRNFFRLRAVKTAHPQMREIVIPILNHFKKELPYLFDLDLDI